MRLDRVWRVLLVGSLLWAGACVPKRAVTSVVKQFEANTGVDVHLSGTRGDPLPTVAAGVELGAVDPKLARAQLPSIERVLMSYPAEVRQEMIGSLYLVGKLRVDGTPFLGLAHPKQGRFEIAIHPRTEPEALQRTLHHEIGHLFEAEAPFKESGFRELSAGRYVGATPVKKWGDADRAEWLGQGFVSRYASKNAMEDFSELAGLAWMRPDRARALAADYPEIGTKLDVLTRVYQRTAPGIVLPWTGDGWEAWRRAQAESPKRAARPGPPTS